MSQTQVTKAMVWAAGNVKTFRGYDVNNGEVDLSKDEYMDILDDVYGTVEICGMTYNHGAALEAIDPVAFRCSLGDYESKLQTELESALESEDVSDIEFAEFEPADIADDETEEDGE